MATTTPNYGWTVPTSTDLVKDGATAIETLGDAIDASMNTALGTKKAGMVLLNTTSFSAVASQSLSANVFTSTYDVYRLIIDLTTISADATVGLRLRVAGTDNSAASYINMGIAISQTGVVSAYSTTTGTFYEILSTDGAIGSHFYSASLELYQPAAAVNTLANRVGQGVKSDSTTYQSYTGNLIHAVTTAYDSCTILTSSGTMTGSISVYGYNK
jgi:hypothetical protein